MICYIAVSPWKRYEESFVRFWIWNSNHSGDIPEQAVFFLLFHDPAKLTSRILCAFCRDSSVRHVVHHSRDVGAGRKQLHSRLHELHFSVVDVNQNEFHEFSLVSVTLPWIWT
jgi:hypothetical protein